jgi:hypothetical protein
MAQVRPEVNLGRSILTPQPSKTKFKAKRTGNLLPIGHNVASNTTAHSINKQQHVASTAVRPGNDSAVNVGDIVTTSSTNNDQPLFIAPTAKMESSQKRKDREATIAHLGKGKGRATSPVSNEASSPVNNNDDTSKHAEPLLTSDVLLDSQQLALDDAKRYQEEVDRYESQRDREDTDFLDPGSQEDDSQTQEDLFESPRRRSRRATGDSVESLLQDSVQQEPVQPKAIKKTPVKQKQLPIQQKPVEQRPVQQKPIQQTPMQQTPVQQTSAQQTRPIPQQQQQQESRKRKADTEIASENPRLSPTARTATSPKSTNLPSREVQLDQKPQHHNNRRFELCSIATQMRRKDAIKAIKTSWDITEHQLMGLPHAPRFMYKWGQPVMKPQDWNTKLLEAVVQLAKVTRGDFSAACLIADEAFEQVRRPGGAKQLNHEILLSALTPQRHGNSAAQASTGITSAQQPAGSRRQSAPSGASTSAPAIEDRQSPDNSTISREIPSRPSLVVTLPVTARSPPPSTTSPTAAYLKSEHVVPIMQQEGFDHYDGESSGSEERLNLESRRQILEHELAIVQLKLDIDDRRKKKEKERKATRVRQLGGSLDEPLLV